MGSEKSGKIILGIDPGTNIFGFGILNVKGSVMSLLDMDILSLDKINGHELKLKQIFECTLSLIDLHHPDELAIEAPFFGKNVQSMLKLGRAQGVAMAAALSCEIPITEYAPKKVKQSDTGNGNASKEQVARMLMSLLSIKEEPKLLDATDALAVAVCHHFQKGKNPGKKKTWESFVKGNSGRVKG